MSLLSVKNLTAAYGPVPALFGVDLEVAAGEVVALMGRNGMGKTTTVKAICRMISSQASCALRIRHSIRCQAIRSRALASGWCSRGAAVSRI